MPNCDATLDVLALEARLQALTDVHEFYEFDATTEEQFDAWLHDRIKEARTRLAAIKGGEMPNAPAEPDVLLAPLDEKPGWLSVGGTIMPLERRLQIAIKERNALCVLLLQLESLPALSIMGSRVASIASARLRAIREGPNDE
jgi:hypothetical protein